MIMKLYLDTTDNTTVSSLTETEFNQVDDDLKGFCLNFKCNEDDVIIINTEMKNGVDTRYSDFSGILLLKWLRIYKRLTNKIIVFGLVPLKSIIELHPEHIILMARGTTYIQFPFSGDELEQAILATKKIKKEELVENYKAFVKADFNIEQFGHSFANEFGLYLMQMMHKYVTGRQLEIETEFSYTILDFIKATFLYSPTPKAPHDIKLISDTIEKLNTTVKEQQSKILYIDDQAGLGWDRLLCDMIFGWETNNNFIVLSDISQFGENNIFKVINKEKPGCVLLDLRLNGDAENNLPIENISGYNLLLNIKKEFPSLPVVMVSATNKADNLTALIKGHAEGLWTKPRVESASGTTNLFDSYSSLLQIIYEALTKFKTPLEKVIFKLNYVGNTEVSINAKNYFFSKSIFIFDTNFFICDNYNGYYKRMRSFILLCKTLKKLNKEKKVIISYDVLTELFLLSYKKDAHNTDTVDKNKRISSNYSLNLITMVMNSASTVIDNNFYTAYQLKQSSVIFSIEKQSQSGDFFLFKTQKEFVDFFGTKAEANIYKTLLKKSLIRTILHADDTLKLLMNHYSTMEQGQSGVNNIYLISDDRKNKYDIYNYIIRKNGIENFENTWIEKVAENEKKLISVDFTYKGNGIERYIHIYSNYYFPKIFSRIERRANGNK